MTEDNTQEAAPAAEPAATAQQEAPAAPASAPAAQAPATPAATSAETAAAPAAVACKCPTVSEADWDKQKKTIEKTFYKGFSPRIFYYPLSFAIDVLRTTKTAVLKGFQEVANPMILDTGGMFLASVLVEVTGGDANNKNIVSLAGKEVYTKVSKRPWKEIKADIAELETELGAKPAELYIWSVSCPKCQSNKEIKTILIAVPGVAAPAAAPAATPAAPAETPAAPAETPAAPAAPAETAAAPAETPAETPAATPAATPAEPAKSNEPPPPAL